MEAYNLANIVADQEKFAQTSFSTSVCNASHITTYETASLLRIFPPTSLGCFLQNKGDGNYKLLYESSNSEPQPTFVSAVSVSDMVSKVKDVFGLSIIQIAELVGVSRPSIYNHISGKESAKYLHEYKKYFDLAELVQSQVNGDIKPGLKSVLVDGKTLLAYLKNPKIEPTKILDVCQKIADKVAERKELTPSSYSDQVLAARLNTIQG
jgi:predicted DNA-binding protein YlxM (UPF0122 family)